MRNGTLLMSSTVASNEGRFLCRADNGVGEPISKLVQVTINGKFKLLAAFAYTLTQVE